MNSTLKQLAIGVAGGLIVLLIIATWGWISDGGLLRFLRGTTVTMFNEEVERIHKRITEVDQKNMSVEIGLGENRSHLTTHQATSAGFVTATASLKGAGRCILYGYAATKSESVNVQGHPDSSLLRGVSALQYAPGGNVHNRPTEDVHPYLPLDSITFPVKRDEFWTVRGCKDYVVRIRFYKLELSGH